MSTPTDSHETTPSATTTTASAPHPSSAATSQDRHAPPPPPSSPADQLVRQLYGLSALRRELARAATREIASNGFTALAAVHRLGPCRVSDVAHELHVDLSVASRQVSALVDAGHVQREVDPEDRRAQLVSTTDAGFGVLVRAHERMVEQLQRGLDDWTDAEIVELAHGIERLVAQFADRRRASKTDTGDDPQEMRA